MASPVNDFALLIRALVKQHGGTKTEFAKAVGLTPSALSHLASNASAQASIEVCLRIARAGNISASRVLQAAGKGHVADLIERLYGPAARFARTHAQAVSARDRALLDEWRTLGVAEQRAMALLISRIAAGTGNALQHREAR